MDNDAKHNRIAMVVGEYMSDCSHMIANYYLPELNCRTNEFRYGIPAAREIKTLEYPLIILPCKVAPGIGLEQANDC